MAAHRGRCWNYSQPPHFVSLINAIECLAQSGEKGPVEAAECARLGDGRRAALVKQATEQLGLLVTQLTQAHLRATRNILTRVCAPSAKLPDPEPGSASMLPSVLPIFRFSGGSAAIV